MASGADTQTHILTCKPKQFQEFRKNHDYYYQIQGALYITERPWCGLFIWTPIGTFVELVDYDPAFWNKVCLRLHAFYHEYLLPEVANPCYPRGQQIRRLCPQ